MALGRASKSFSELDVVLEQPWAVFLEGGHAEWTGVDEKVDDERRS